jgi:RNA polymerase sigma-70 factor (ECF subfamily)
MMGSDDVSALVLEHGRFVWRVLRHQGVVESQLEDLSQEVFLVMFRRFSSFENRSSIRTWIYGICRHVAADARRRRRRKPEVLMDSVPETASPEHQTQHMLNQRTRAHLHTALDQLPEGARIVFALYEIENMPMAEVAQSVGCSLSTAYTRLYAARKRVLGALLAAGVDDGELTLAVTG